MRKIMIIGCPGAGKSTLAKELAAITGLPLFHLDLIWHKPNKTTATRDEFDKRLDEILKYDSWIIDGNYQRTLKKRLSFADTVILLNYKKEVCLAGAAERVGKKRSDMPWTESELDPEFEKLILDFSRDKLPEILRLINEYGEGKRIFILNSREEAAELLSEFRKNAG